MTNAHPYGIYNLTDLTCTASLHVYTTPAPLKNMNESKKIMVIIVILITISKTTTATTTKTTTTII